MKLLDISLNKEISNRDKFGLYVRTRRLELGMSVRELAQKLNLTPAYISDIENGNRTAPLKHLNKLAEILQVKSDELDAFNDIAGCSHSNWPEINEYLAKTPDARKAIRLARDRNIPEQDLLNMILNTIKDREQSDDLSM